MSTKTTPEPIRPISEAELCQWIGSAVPGERLIYHRGFLSRDCADAAPERAELRRVARRARLASDAGLVHLVQRKNGPDDYSYIMIAREKPQPRRGTLDVILNPQAEASMAQGDAQ